MQRRANQSSNVSGQRQFATVAGVQAPRSVFNRSSGLKTTLFNAGNIYPIYLDEILPGDTFSMNATLFARVATLLNPLMDQLYLDTHFFFVPLRLVWENFHKFMGEQDDPGDTVDFLIPELERATVPDKATRFRSIWDYFGLPSEFNELDPDVHINALPFRCYNRIYNEWYRDQNLQDSVINNTGDGPDDFTDYAILRRGKRHDYFTSCLPFPQKGPAVQLPLGTTAPVVTTGTTPLWDHGNQVDDIIGTSTSQLDVKTGLQATSGDTDLKFGTITGLETDLSSAIAATINTIRQAFQIQKLYERDARGGTRYTEIIVSHFGVHSDDARLNRPEYLGGGSAPLSVQPVPQTNANVTSGYALADLGAWGTIMSQQPSWTRSFTEHGFLLGLASIRGDLNYQEGKNKLWDRRGKHDFYWPTLAHIGEQAVLQSEIHNLGDATDHDVFGYQERFAEYRYKPSMITSGMRSEAAASYDVWHLAQDFGATAPLLNAAFIVEQPPVGRVIADFTDEHFLLDCYFSLTCVRPIPSRGTPGLVDHF